MIFFAKMQGFLFKILKSFLDSKHTFHAFISYGCKAFPVVIHVILLFVCKFLSLVFILMNIRDANAFEVNGNHDATTAMHKMLTSLFMKLLSDLTGRCEI